ncbi:MAG: Gfo/Idh/MocA family oxidoreductase [Spirochaetota bacterium]
MDTIRTAILGYGRNGSTMHAGGVGTNKGFTMAAVCDIDAKRRDEAAQRFSCPAYTDHRKMLAKEKLDLVIIVTRTDQHCAMTCDALSAGANVLVTKPWAVNAREARTMIAAAKRTKRMLLPWLPTFWGADTRRLREIIEQKTIGDVFMIRRIVTAFGTRSDWQTEKRCGGGYLLNWGPHIVFPAVLIGGGKPRTVYGNMKQVINPGDVEDNFFAAITLSNGTLVLAEHTMTPTAMPNWIVQGTKGSVIVHGKQLTLIRHEPPKPDDPTKYADMKGAKPSESVETLGDIYGDTNEIYAAIAKAIRGEAAYPVSLDAALELSTIFDAIRSSNEKKRIVSM